MNIMKMGTFLYEKFEPVLQAKYTKGSPFWAFLGPLSLQKGSPEIPLREPKRVP